MNAVIYARYSPGPQQTEQSIEGQLRECMSYAKKFDITVVGTYTDSAQSGHTDKRQGFQQMLKDSKKGLFDAVIVWKVNRFGRNREEIIYNKVKLKKSGVKVLYAAESIPDGKDGILLESVLEGLAEYQWESIREDVIRGMREGAFQCKYNGAGLALGFKIDSDKHYQIDTEKAEIVKHIFEMYDGGSNITQIIDYLDERGIKTAKGNSFSHTAVARILQNKQYIGVYRWRDVVVPDGIPKIIDEALFERVQKKMIANKKAPARSRGEVEFLLTGKLYCGHCQGGMIGDSGTGKSGRKWYYYSCINKKRRGHVCKKKTVKKDEIERLIVEHTVNYVLQDEVIEYIVDLVMEAQSEEMKDTSMLDYFESRLRETESAIKNLMKAIEQGIITDTTRERLLELEAEKRDINAEIIKEQIVRPTFEREQIIYFLESFKGGDVDDKDYQRRIIDMFIYKVVLYDDKLIITYNYSGSNNEVTIDLIEKAAENAALSEGRGVRTSSPRLHHYYNGNFYTRALIDFYKKGSKSLFPFPKIYLFQNILHFDWV